jgi:hypothetical protein
MIINGEKPKMIGTSEALKFVIDHGPGPITLPTIIEWCGKYDLGVKIGGRWYVYEERLKQFLDKGKINEKKA